MSQKYFQISIIIVIFYTIAQVVCLSVFGYTPYPDSEGYILLAKECVANGTFYPVDLKNIPFLWNIGAINAIVASLYLFGTVMPLLVLYSLMQGLMAFLVYAIAEELYNHKVALVSLFLFVLYPANYGCGTSVLSEVPFIFFSLSALYLSLKKRYVFAGICFAVANSFRPMAIIFICGLLLYMFFKKTAYRKYLYLTAGYIAVMLSIGMTNYVIKDKYFTQGAMGWMGLMQYSWDHDSDKATDYLLFDGNDPNRIDESLGYDCLQRDSVWRSHFLKWLPGNKLEYIRQMPEKLFKTYVSDNVNFCAFLPGKEHREYMYQEISMPVLKDDFPHWTCVQVLTCVNLLYYYLLLFCGFCGVVYGIRQKLFDALIIPVTTIVAGTALLLLVGHGEARFHQPLMPMFILLSGCYMTKFLCRRIK